MHLVAPSQVLMHFGSRSGHWACAGVAIADADAAGTGAGAGGGPAVAEVFGSGVGTAVHLSQTVSVDVSRMVETTGAVKTVVVVP